MHWNPGCTKQKGTKWGGRCIWWQIPSPSTPMWQAFLPTKLINDAADGGKALLHGGRGHTAIRKCQPCRRLLKLKALDRAVQWSKEPADLSTNRAQRPLRPDIQLSPHRRHIEKISSFKVSENSAKLPLRPNFSLPYLDYKAVSLPIALHGGYKP